MANILSSLKVFLPTKKPNPKGVSSTETYNSDNTENILSAPAYRDHLSDIFTDRTSGDSRELLKKLFVNDPDVSAAVNAFLTVADTEMDLLVRDINGEIDIPGQQLAQQALLALTTRIDYTKGFKIIQSKNWLAESMRYMILLRGGVAAELVVSKEFLPAEVRMVDLGKIEWFEKLPGQYTPQQKTLNGDFISLDIPTFFVTWFRRDPTGIYTNSPFVSAINTIAARQQVINDLYRIMQLTGYPRMDIKVLEDVLLKNAPPATKLDANAQSAYIQAQVRQISLAIGAIRPDQAFVHTDSVEAGMMNEKSAANSLDIQPVINVLNAQNQAGLRTMASIIGRGESGVNTASVEARIFSLNAEAINKPVADILSQMLTFALRLLGSESVCEVSFANVELRPLTELEPNLMLRSQRLKEDLSLGLITDEEYALQMYGRLPPTGAPQLSGTGFAAKGTAGADGSGPDTTPSNPNDPVTKQARPKGGEAARGKNNKGGSAK